MNDPRITDAVRKIPELIKKIDDLTLLTTKLREDNTYMKDLLRQIKKSVTRKYEKNES